MRFIYIALANAVWIAWSAFVCTLDGMNGLTTVDIVLLSIISYTIGNKWYQTHGTNDK